MKRFWIILGILLTCVLLAFFFSTSYVKRASYLDADYYKKTTERIDSIKSAMVIVEDSVQAGFSKISITPSLNNSEENY